MNASAYFVQLAARGTRAPNGTGWRAAGAAQAFLARATQRIRRGGVSNLPVRPPSLAWQVRRKPQAGVVPATAAMRLSQHTERFYMFALTRIERLLQPSAAARLPAFASPHSASTTVAAASQAQLTAPPANKLASTMLSTHQHSLQVLPRELRQTWLRTAAANLPLPVAQSRIPPTISPAPHAPSRAESRAPVWLTARLQKISQHRISVIGRAPSAVQRLVPPTPPLATAHPVGSAQLALESLATGATAATVRRDTVQIEYRSAPWPRRQRAMLYSLPAPTKLSPSVAQPNQIAPSLRARAAAAMQVVPQATAHSGKTEFASRTLPATASATAAVAQANSVAAQAMAARFAPAAPESSAHAPAHAPSTASATPLVAQPAKPEPEWVDAVQRVIFTRHVLDKVTDDVVAKIEKRLRIERERRGM